MTLEKLQAEMDDALQFPGFPNVWTQPIRNRLDMLLTGIKTPVGIKILGPDLERDPAARARDRARRCRACPARAACTPSAWRRATSPTSTIDRDAIARYGLTVDDVQDVIETAIGGENVTRTIEGRERYPVNVRYAARLPRQTAGARARARQDADRRAGAARRSSRAITLTPGPAMIRDENGQLAGYVYVDTATRDIGGYVDARAGARSRGASTLPPGYTLQWTGQYEFQVRARERLQAAASRSSSSSSSCCCT